MLLLQLPPETLYLIFAYIESSWFREDLKRLTISRVWYGFAVEVCYRHFVFSQRAIQCLTSCPTMRASSSNFQRVTETATLKLFGFQNWKPSSTSWTPLRGSCQIDFWEDQREEQFELSRSWFYNFLDTMDSFTQLLRRSQRLHSLCVIARPEFYPYEWDARRYNYGDYIRLRHIKILIGTSTLKSLALDFYGLDFRPHYKIDHFCSVIARLLTTLHDLKLRMPLICPRVLRIAEDYEGDLKLRDLVINLSCMTRYNSPHLTSHLCREQNPTDDENLRQTWAQARNLQARMAKPNRLSVIVRKVSYPTREIPSLRRTIVDYRGDNWMTRPLDQDFGSEYEDLMQSL